MSSAGDVATLKAVFGDEWTEEDLKQVLQESRGDVDLATDRILSGKATKFGEVTKKKDRQTAKKNDFGFSHSSNSNAFGTSFTDRNDRGLSDRGRGRGRGGAAARGGRGDGRGRGRGRGGASSFGGGSGDAEQRQSSAVKDTTSTWAAPEQEAVPVDTTSTWDVQPAVPSMDDWDASPAPAGQTAAWDEPVTSVLDAPAEPIATDSWLDSVDDGNRATPAAQAKPKSRIIDKNSKSSWASIAKPPPAAPKPAPVPAAAAAAPSAPAKAAPLTEENLEAVTENQPDLPLPPTQTLRSVQGEPATGPSSIAAAPGTPGASIVPTGAKAGAAQQRTGTPLGGRRLNHDQAVIMPGSEQQPGTKLSLQFGSLDLEDEQDNNQAAGAQAGQVPQQHQQQHPQQQQGGDKLYDNFGPGYGNYGMPGQPTGPYPGFGQGHAQYGNMSSFYGGQEVPRPSPFGDYYGNPGQPQQQQPGAHHAAASPVQGGPAHASARDNNSSSNNGRYAQGAEATGGSPIAAPMTHQQGLAAPLAPAAGSPAQHGVPQAYGGYPQGGYNPNPYAYYGYGYPQGQPYGAYGAPSMYGQQPNQQAGQGGVQGQQRGTVGGGGGGYGGSAGLGYLGQAGQQGGSTHALGTSQDRYERSTADYQRGSGHNGAGQGDQQQQQGQQQQQAYGTHSDFLGGRSASQQQQQQQSGGNGHEAVGSEDAYKGYGTNASTPSRDAAKVAQGYGYPQQGGQQQGQQQYGSHAQYGQQGGGGNQYAQYAQYGARGGWNQQSY